jgi:hypothetical protein
MRSPISVQHLRELVQLGQFLDTFVDGKRIGGRRLPLLWSEPGRALIVLAGNGFHRSPPRRLEHATGQGARVYRRWTRGREPAHEREVTITQWPSEWKVVGPAERIGYRSDKFHQRGETVDYEHEFGRDVRLYLATHDTHGVFVWRGGSLRLTTHGIEG